MASSYPPGEHHVSPPFLQSFNSSYFTVLARRAGYLGPELGWSQQEHLQYHRPYWHPSPHHLNMHEIIRREIERQQLNGNIIMSGFSGRHVPEAEVRREMVMARDLALQRASNGFSVSSVQAILCESLMRLPRSTTRMEMRFLLEEIISRLFEERERLNGMCESGGFNTLPFQRGNADLRTSEVTPSVEEGTEKEKIRILAKPDGNISGSKRNAVTRVDASELLKKKAKVEWSCAVCHFSAFTEKELNEHLRGRKHKREEAKMRRAHRGSKNFRIGFSQKESSNNNNASESLQFSKMGVTCSKSGDPTSLQENLNTESLEKNKLELVQNMQKEGKLMKKRHRARKKIRKRADRLHEFEQNDKDLKFSMTGLTCSKNDNPTSLPENLSLESLKKHELELEKPMKRRRKARKRNKHAYQLHEFGTNDKDCQRMASSRAPIIPRFPPWVVSNLNANYY